MTDRELFEKALEALELLAKYEHPLTKILVRKPRDGGSIVIVYPHQVATDAAELLRERLAQPEQCQYPDCKCGSTNPNLHSTECFEDYEKATGMSSVEHAVIAGALFDFMGWLTSRKQRIVLSSADNASPAVEAITEFAKMRSLSLDDAKVRDWQKRLEQPLRTHWEGCEEVHPECKQPEQEPVAWLVQYSNKHEFVWGQKPQWIADAIGIEPLYTTPQRREWVGLTRDEVLDIEEAAKHPLDFARSIEAKLKEKNT